MSLLNNKYNTKMYYDPERIVHNGRLVPDSITADAIYNPREHNIVAVVKNENYTYAKQLDTIAEVNFYIENYTQGADRTQLYLIAAYKEHAGLPYIEGHEEALAGEAMLDF